ncbi:oligopeptide ABC transporter substrate-binding protein [Kurthia sibirica]|uniref:Oligopeptide ABC transporter substrate-binding protein n=1 Tax=Kurthia sibirica TaxID=202750 RepID=A0A2U3ANP2_9BACL|nr:oligopeptide ABC transporter substrate-binding protein [Kurthia sibirica]PWI26154.1 oligopeptide ABC transporter substrate-binding protein [Kurthia sibirica]GEK33412.1 peptide ABC transporter substrate-binding protein [Kurthia sibirica]
MKKKSWLLLTVLAAIMLVLAACGGGDKDGGKTKEKEKVNTSTLPLKTENKDASIKGGTLKVALSSDAPFKGLFLYEVYEDAYDAEILGYTSNSIFPTKEDFLIGDDGIGKLAVDEDKKVATVTIPKDIKWSDGEPLTAEDLIYPYLIIGDKDYTGVRYDTNFQNIIGAKEYHDGKADSISGIKKVDDQTIEISFKKISPAIYSGGDGLWGYAAPAHQLKDIKVKDLEKSDAVRKNPATLGAFVINKIVKGESVEMVANKNYWKGQPKLDKVVISVVPSTSIAASLKAGKYDLAVPNYPANDYATIKDLKNITILGRPELAYSYLGFKLGKWDSKKSEVIVDEKAKMNDKDLRQAIAYAMDIEQVADVYYDGLRSRANSLIPPVFSAYYDDSLKGYSYDKKKAEELLDKAGYKDTDKDGFREDKNGKPLTIKLAGMAGSDKDNKIAQFYIQNWKDVGLKVELTTGRLIEFNSFYDKVKADDKDIDMYMAAWGTGTDPSPIGLYSKAASFNYNRYTSPELETMLGNIDSKESLDPAYRSEAFLTWQQFMSENAATVPMYFRTELIPVNKRVKNWDIDYLHSSTDNLQDVELSAEEPIKE